jgi:hypothetical protein
MRRLPQRREKVTNLASVLLPREAVAKASKKKDGGNSQPLAGAPTAAAAAAAGGGRGPQGDKHPRQISSSDDGGVRCPVHNSARHSTGECQKIKKLVDHYHEQLKQQQQHEDDAPSRQRESKEVDSEVNMLPSIKYFVRFQHYNHDSIVIFGKRCPC